MGRAYAEEANRYGDFSAEELADEDAFCEAVGDILENHRQMAGHPTYDFGREKNSDSLFEAFEDGEGIGMRAACRQRFDRNGEPRA